MATIQPFTRPTPRIPAIRFFFFFFFGKFELPGPSERRTDTSGRTCGEDMYIFQNRQSREGNGWMGVEEIHRVYGITQHDDRLEV